MTVEPDCPDCGGVDIQKGDGLKWRCSCGFWWNVYEDDDAP